MPEEPPPPAIDFNCWIRTYTYSSIVITIFILDIFVSPSSVSFLNIKKFESVIGQLLYCIFS
jgi:hypothetical protein